MPLCERRSATYIGGMARSGGGREMHKILVKRWPQRSMGLLKEMLWTTRWSNNLRSLSK